MMGGAATTGFFMLILWIATLILAVVWICLPFAVFGIKPKIDEQTKLLREILAYLKKDEPVAQAETVGGTKPAPATVLLAALTWLASGFLNFMVISRGI